MINAREDQIETEILSIISSTRRLKSLSHRAVMFALLDAGTEGGDAAAASACDEAVSAFGDIVGHLRGAGDQVGARADAQLLLREAEALSGDNDRLLSRFMADAPKAKALDDQKQRLAALKGLADFVAGELHDGVDEIGAGLQRSLEQASAARIERDAASRQVISESIAKIEKVSFAVRLIALNASVEAARAGEFGKGFSVIASEIKSLSESTSTTVQDLQRQLSSMG